MLFGENNGLVNKQDHHGGVWWVFGFFFFPFSLLNLYLYWILSASGPAAEMQAVGSALVLKGKREGGNRAGYDLRVTLICL